MNYNSSNKKIRIGHLNVRSLFPSMVQFSSLINKNNLDIMTVSETWLNDDIPTNIIKIPNYRFLRKDRQGRGGGVGIYVRESIKCKIVLEKFGCVEGVEHLWIELHFGRLNILLGVIYRVPTNNVVTFLQHIDDLLSFTMPQFENIIILGDFNIDQSLDNVLADCMCSYDFQQLISEPTRITTHSQKIIDLIFSNNCEFILNSGTINADSISDHRAVFCDLDIALPRSKPKFVTYRNFKNFSYDNFLVDLNHIQWNNIFYLGNIEEKIAVFNQYILELFDKHAPFVTSRVTKPYAPWLTHNVKELMKLRNKAKSKYKITKNINDWNSYKSLRNSTVSAIRREKIAYLSQQQRNNNTKEFWQAIKHLNIKQQRDSEIPLDLQKPNEINNYFLSVYSAPNSCLTTVNNYKGRRFNNDLTFSLSLATVDDIRNILFSMKSNAYGTDNINAKMLQLCAPVNILHITHIINCCLENGYFPELWKTSLVRPLPKVREPSIYSDLRPISIIPAISKLLEKIVYTQIYDYSSINNMIGNYQSGFRKGFSTTTALLNISDDIISALDKGSATALVLLDFSKAFDTLDHSLLCAKLEYYGFSNTSVNFFRNYLSNRKQKVVLGNYFSDLGYITSGVPQGSVLGPLLFLLYTSDISNIINFTKIQAYADDTQISLPFDPKLVKTASDNINYDLNAICKYSQEHNLKLNSSKCSVICFCPRKAQHLVQSNLTIKINDLQLDLITSVKSLGIIFDTKLRFQEHVTQLIKKSYIALKLLYLNTSILNYKLRKKLCETYVLPILNYCNILYFPCLDKITQYRLQKIQNTCCRFVCGLKKFDHVSTKINELGWLRLNNQVKYQLSVFVHRLLSTSSPTYLREKLFFRYNMHNVNIRFGNTLCLPQFHSAIFKRSFTYNATVTYNSIPQSFKILPVNSFRKKVRSYFLSLQ